ncbi:MAG: hypothetical protein ABW019_06710 [Chitinophagaceae bacterium]
MKIIKLLLLLSVFSTLAAAQTDSVPPARFVSGNITLHLKWSDADYNDADYLLGLNFRYDVQTKSRVSINEVTRAVRSLIPLLKPAISRWKDMNKESTYMPYWQFYQVDIGLYSPAGDSRDHLFRYLIDPRNDSLADIEKAFSMSDSVTGLEYIYDIAYLDRLTGLTEAKRVKLYEQLAAKIFQCASGRVAPLLAAWDEKVTQDDIDQHNRYGRRAYYLDCFRRLIKKHIKVSDPQALVALYAELCSELGDEDEWEMYGVKY